MVDVNSDGLIGLKWEPAEPPLVTTITKEIKADWGSVSGSCRFILELKGLTHRFL